ncbi:MAG: hypothetical protein EAS48_01640 [Chryseobacterium sp.]|nr:MAG: hypothetical protein EAS48_01640 [Chryseobacterium sp.]
MFGLFKSKKVIFKGRAGLIFNPNKNESYYVDSEMLNGKYDIVIYENSIRKLSGNKQLEDIYKSKILKLLFEELKKQNIKYDIGS